MAINRIQYVSNLFLSKSRIEKYPVKPVAPILALLGNIGEPGCQNTKKFFKWAETEYKHIFWIPGALEYSSPPNLKITWRERSDFCYASIKDWKLKKTSFCQKSEILLNSSSILATPCWHVSMGLNLFDWNSEKNGVVHMGPQEFFNLQIDELGWILRKAEKSQNPCGVMTYSPVPYELLNHKNILYHLYGTEYSEKKSASGGSNPWNGINMGDAKGYRLDAFLEWSRKPTPK